MEPGKAFQTGSQVIDTIMREIAAGNIEHAAELYSRCQDDIGYSLINAIPRDQRLRKATAKMFYIAKDYEKAALIFEQADEYDKAAMLYEKCEDYLMAAEMYSRVELFDKAAAMFEKAGNYDQAAQLFTQVGDFDRAAVNFERAINNFLAGKMYFKLGKYNKAVELLQKVKYGDHTYFEATALIGTVLAKNGYTDMAIRKYESVAKVAQLDESTVDVYYDLGQLYAGKGLTAQAIDVLSRVVDFDFNYKDAAGLLDKLRIRGGAAHAGDTVVELEAEPETTAEAQAAGGQGIVAVMEGFEFLKNTPLFQELNLQEMKSLFNLCETKHFTPGQVIIEQDKPGVALYILKSGKVNVERIESESRRQLAELGAGTHLGEMSLIDDAPTSAQVTALEPTEAFEISRVKFYKLMESNDRLHVKVTRSFIRTLNERLRKTSAEYTKLRKDQEKMLSNLFPEA
jgi:tetratricopeptide (TPR) repeat protein